jgi:hypothetical protein
MFIVREGVFSKVMTITSYRKTSIYIPSIAKDLSTNNTIVIINLFKRYKKVPLTIVLSVRSRIIPFTSTNNFLSLRILLYSR